MTKRLLNKNNLIIVMISICLALFTIPNVVFCATVPLSDYLKETISVWYLFVKYLCIAVMFILLIVTGIKAAISVSPETKSDFKKLMLYWIIGIFLLSMLEEIIYLVISVEQDIVSGIKGIGTSLVNEPTSKQQISLYESAKTKAYEISLISGTIGIIMYIIIVYYTFKFFFIYIKRYMNVMILILISPIVVVLHTYRKIFTGKGGVIGRWTKEFIYNVFIQVIHATMYSILVGYTLSLSDNTLSFLGAILTFIVFFFMSQIDGIFRKIFNFVGGSTSIEARDYASLVKHPIDSVKDAKDYITGTLPQEVENKAINFAENLTPENVLSTTARYANNFAFEAKETMAALDGKRVKVSQKEIKREQEKIDNPNAIQKIYNTVQGLALGAASAAVTGIESTAKKIKEKLKELDKSTKKAREELNQDAEIVKRFAKVIKNHVKRKIISDEAIEEDKQPQESLQATVVNLLDTPEEEIIALRLAIKKSYNDMAAIIYETQGPAVFIYPELSSGYIGLSVLASSKYEQKYSSSSIKKGKIIAFPKKQLEQAREKNEVGKIVSIDAAKKKYKLKRYNMSSVITITNSLNRRYILNNEYLSSLYRVSQMVVGGDISVAGRYNSADNIKFRRTSIKYTAKAKSHKEDKFSADITLARYSAPEVREESLEKQDGKIVNFNSVYERKMQAQETIQNYKSRVQDSKWAVLEAVSTDVRELHKKEVQASVQEVSQRTSTDIVLQQLTDMGQAVKINSEVYITFSDKSVQQVIEEVQEDISEDTTNQMITDETIIDTAIKFDIPLEELDLKNDVEIQEAVLEELMKKGIVSSNIRLDENESQKEQVIESLEERKENIFNDKKENYVSSVMKKAAAKIFVDTVDAGDKLANKITDSKLINNEYTKVLGQIAKSAVEIEAERVKEDLLNQIHLIGDMTKEYVEAGSELYGISKNDIKRKAEQISNDANNFAAKIGEAVEKTAKSVVDAAIEPFRITPKKDRKDDEDNFNKEIFTFTIEGAVAVAGKYSLKLSTIKAITGKNPSSIDDLEFIVYDALKVAGGPTDDADLAAISYYDIVKNGAYVFIPSRASDNEEESLEKCKTIVADVIKDYLVENSISNVEALRKLVHKRTITSRVKEKARNMKITNQQIEALIEKRIKELKFIRDALKETTKDIKIIDKSDIEVEETESIKKDRVRQENGAKNSEDLLLDDALKRLHSLSIGERNEESQENSELANQNTIMNELLSQLEDKKEKVLVSARASAENKNVNRLEFDNQGKRNARERFVKNPNQMINEIIGRI